MDELRVEDALDRFAAEHPDLMEALQVFGIASSEYDRAISALYPIATYDAASTNELP